MENKSLKGWKVDTNYFNEPEKYYLNSQKYSECQLVTAINAAIYLCELPITQNSIEYERLVDLVCARNGSAISIELAYSYLRIIPTEIIFEWNNMTKYLDKKYPIEVSLWHKKFGLHSSLIIDYKIKPRNVRILNFTYETDKNCWMEWSCLRQYVVKTKIKMSRKCAYYNLNPWYIRDLQIKNNIEILNSSNLLKREENSNGKKRK